MLFKTIFFFLYNFIKCSLKRKLRNNSNAISRNLFTKLSILFECLCKPQGVYFREAAPY